MTAALKGANNSTQYNGIVTYKSLLSLQEDTIRIEVALREPILLGTSLQAAATILLNPITEKELVDPVVTHCIRKDEAFSEKFRAALTRREAAIRDFFDIDYAVLHLGLRPDDKQMLDLVRQKLAIPGNPPIDISRERLDVLRRQIDPQLKPVLRDKDFRAFDLDRAFKIAIDIAAKLK